MGRNKKFATSQITLIVSLYNGKYAMETGEGKCDFSDENHSHFHRHLTNKYGDSYGFGIKISLYHLRNILNQHGFVSVASKNFKETHNHKVRILRIKYLPGLEAFNKDLKTNFMNDFKRHNIKTMQEAKQ